MSVVVTARGAGLGAWIDEDFARCRQIVLVECDGTFDAWANPSEDDSDGETLARRIVSSTVKLEALVTRSIRPQALAILRLHDVPVYLAEQGSVFEVAEKARSGALGLTAAPAR